LIQEEAKKKFDAELEKEKSHIATEAPVQVFTVVTSC
jgi:hypothetical protein